MELALYQTLKDEENPDYVEQNGPFKCTRQDAWLDFGYYFWDAHVELGHWWGNMCYGQNYIICSADAVLDHTCWDLYGNGKHRIELREIYNYMINSNIAKDSELTLPKLIRYLKTQKLFNWKAIRALGQKSKSSASAEAYQFRLYFNPRYSSYIDGIPAVQVCLLEKNALTLRKYRIVHPENYTEQLFA